MNTETQKPMTQPKIITRADLPLACPTPDMPLWSQHPRVFLPIERTGKATCPYCSAQYVLAGNEAAHV